MFPRVTHPSATPPCEGVRLACVKPAASVRSEPGSNSQVVETTKISNPTKSQFYRSARSQTSRRVPNTPSVRILPRTNTMNFENVTVGAVLLPMPESISVRPRSEPQGPRRPRFSFFRCNCQTAGKPKPTRNVQPAPQHQTKRRRQHTRQTLPGINHQTEVRNQSNPAARSQSSAAVDDRDIRRSGPAASMPVSQKLHASETQHRHPRTAGAANRFATGGHRAKGDEQTRQHCSRRFIS